MVSLKIDKNIHIHLGLAGCGVEMRAEFRFPWVCALNSLSFCVLQKHSISLTTY